MARPHVIALALGAAIALACSAAGCNANEDRVGFVDGQGSPGALTPAGTDAGVIPSVAPDAGLCTSTECPAPYATCTTSTYRCDKNFDTDGNNCGGCGIKCPGADDTSVESALHADWRCSSAVCKMSCLQGFADCNAAPGDGCETNLNCDSNNCGGCGIKCAAGVTCIAGACGCQPGLTKCGEPSCGKFDFEICKDLTVDKFSCGACGNECPQPANLPQNTISGCKGSTCGHLECATGFDDCNLNLADGCEVDLSKDKANCGACGFACSAGQQCHDGECLCAPGAELCESGTAPDVIPYCAFVDVDPKNCGACGRTCPLTSTGKPACRDGRCLLECPVGTADCDGSWGTGCETTTDSDPNNCGGCGIHCDVAAGQPCIRGECALKPCPGATVQ